MLQTILNTNQIVELNKREKLDKQFSFDDLQIKHPFYKFLKVLFFEKLTIENPVLLSKVI